MRIRIAAATFALVLDGASTVDGQASATPVTPALSTARSARVVVYRATEPIRVDARLDEVVWRSAEPFEIPFETYPGNNTAARVRTECRVASDATTIYLGCHALDANPAAIRAVRADRDDVLEHDRIGITIDPFNDRRRAWQFAITPLGVQYDAVYDAQSEDADAAWNAIWTSAGRIVSDGYVVEASIPFKSLRFPAGARDWGFLAWRMRPRDANVAMHSVRIDQAIRCLLCQTGALTGFTAPAPSRNVELNPTLTTIRTDRRRAPAEVMARGDVRSEVGLDVRWSVTPDVTINATANPDFSQVEADAAQLEANNRFALSYPERRPFFLDGADLFSSPTSVVFTRAIADPIAGAKFTAKHGATAIALLGAHDAVTNLLMSGHDESARARLDDPSTAVIARIRRDIMGSSTVGFLGTYRESEGYANRVTGIDALLRPHPTTTLTTQALYSATRYPDTMGLRLGQPARYFSGSLIGAHGRYQTRGGNVDVLAWRYTQGFRADLGFIPQVGVLDAEIHGDRVFWGAPGSWVTRLALGAGWYPSKHDTTPGFVNAWRFLRLAYDGPAGVQYRFYGRIRSETFNGVRYDFWTPWMALYLQPSKTIGASVEATFGGEIDYEGSRLARTVRLSPTTTIRLARDAEVRLRHSNLRLYSGRETLLRAGVSEARAAYHPTSRTFVRALVQYRTTHRTATSSPLVPESRDRSLGSQLLLSYRVDAQTAALVGYGDTRDAPYEPATPNDRNGYSELRPIVRSFFVKLSYAWRP